VSAWIADVLDHMGDESVVKRVAAEVTELCRRFPVYA
jgi:glycine hydroxymethyltransferase